VAVEPVGSVTFGGAPGKRNIPGIGTSVRPKLADLAKPDRIVAVNEQKTVEACLSFLRDYHLLVGGSSGTVLAAVQQLAPEFRRGDTIVAISADLGEKYLDTIYDPAWVEKVIGPEDDTPVRTDAFVAAELGTEKAVDLSQPAPWRKDMPTDPSQPARVSQLIDTISDEQHLSRA
jgi:threonine synthase